MKYLVLIIFFFATGACSTKSNVFDGTDGTSSSSENSSGNSSNENAANETSNEGTTNETTDQKTPPEKAIDMSEENDLPDVEGTQRLHSVCTHKTNDADIRTVSVIDTVEGHCGTVYTKFGKKKTEAYAQVDMNFCERVYNGIINNLKGPEGNGPFNCEGDIPPEIPDTDNTGVETGANDDPDSSGDPPSDGAEQQQQQQPSDDSDNNGGSNDNNDDGATVQFMDISKFLQMRGRERISMNCKKEDDKRVISVIDTVEGPCGVVHKDNDEEKLETFQKYDMSKCDDAFNNLVDSLIGQGFGCQGSGSSAIDDEADGPADDGSES